MEHLDFLHGKKKLNLDFYVAKKKTATMEDLDFYIAKNKCNMAIQKLGTRRETT
jgi:hypothetical protein